MWKYVLFQITFHTLGRLPVPVLYRVTDLLGDICYALLSQRRRNVWDNMRHVLGPDAAKAALRRAARDVFRNVARYYGDLIHMTRIDLNEFLDRRLRYHGFEEHLAPALKSGRGVILVSGHFGNPELAVQVLRLADIKAFALTEPLNPPRLSRLVDGLRSSQGHTFVPVSVANVKTAIRTIKSGGLVALLCDRDVAGPRAVLPLCGEETLMPTGPVELAMRTGAILIPTFSHRRQPDRIEAFIEEPLELVDSGDFDADVRANTLRLLARFERHLRQDPGQWIVLERVWEADAGPVQQPVAAGETRR